MNNIDIILVVILGILILFVNARVSRVQDKIHAYFQMLSSELRVLNIIIEEDDENAET